MQILNANLYFKQMVYRNVNNINTLFLHHTSTETETIQQIHQSHLNNGWAGIGYNWFVRKNGEVWKGREIQYIPSGVLNHNSNSVHICFEGNFEIDTMTAAQLQAGFNIIDYVKKLLPNIKTILGHREVMATDCPGKNFPLDSFKNFFHNGIETGWKEGIDGRWQYINANGSPVINGWVQDSHGWLYMDGTGWSIINGLAADSHGICVIKNQYWTGERLPQTK
jgi:hypothetical protein